MRVLQHMPERPRRLLARFLYPLPEHRRRAQRAVHVLGFLMVASWLLVMTAWPQGWMIALCIAVPTWLLAFRLLAGDAYNRIASRQLVSKDWQGAGKD